MKILLILSLLFTTAQPGTPDTTKAETKKKQSTAPKPPSKKSKAALPFLPFLIVDNR
ncbi:MAG TPA: hypothetical protein VF609_01325 [Flavisolibacter sp.]